MATYKDGHVIVEDVWFDNTQAARSADVVKFWNRGNPEPGAWCKVFNTMTIDLNQSHEEILAGMSKNTRYKVSRAEKRDPITYEAQDCTNPDTLVEFLEHFNAFACQKGQPQLEISKLQGYAESGHLDLSVTRLEDQSPLVWHAHFRSGGRSCLMHSASLYRAEDDSAFRSLVGRANRYHHWRDMLRFKDKGDNIYDLGGWYAKGNDEEQIRIRNFKSGFGGVVVKRYNCEKGTAPKGVIYCTSRGIPRRLFRGVWYQSKKPIDSYRKVGHPTNSDDYVNDLGDDSSRR